MIVEAIFWFHPLVWWIGARLIAERERACDEEVLRQGNAPDLYADAILNVCKLCTESPLACVSGVSGADIRQRIEAILLNRKLNALTRAKKFLLAAAGFASLAGPIAIGLIIGVADTSAVRAQSPVPPVAQMTPPSAAAPAQIAHPAPTRPTPGTPVSFDAAVVKPVLWSGDRDCSTGVIGSKDPGRFRCETVSLKELLQKAYGVYSFQLDGPGWLDAKPPAFFYVEATMPRETTQPQLQEMLQRLLADRFKLTAHRETAQRPIYSLVVGSGGPRMKESTETETTTDDFAPPQRGPNDSYGMPTFQLDHPAIFLIVGPLSRLIVRQQTMTRFAKRLTEPLGRTVVDATGLTARYDFTLTFANEGSVPQADLDGAPDVRVALQEQLGLKLESGKGPVEMIVIDHIEKTPTEN